MAIDKKKFHNAVVQMKAKPNDPRVQAEYCTQIKHMAEIISKRYKIFPIEDGASELMLSAFHKKLHTKVDENKQAFTFYWTAMMRMACTIKTTERDSKLYLLDDFMVNNADEGGEFMGDMIMFKNMNFTLDEYVAEPSMTDTIMQADTIELSGKRQGRPKTRADGEKAQHWEYIFTTLKRKKTMTEQGLLNLLEKDKLAALKDPSKAMELRIREIARRQSLTVSITNHGNEKIYMIVGV